MITLELLAPCLLAGPFGEAAVALPEGFGIAVTEFVIAVEAEMFGKARHRRGLHPRPARLFAHGEKSHLAGMVDDIARRRLQLRGKAVKGGDDPVAERSLVHASFYNATWRLQHMFQYARL